MFDIDGVLRDVAKSYRLAIQETVKTFIGWRPTLEEIDALKSEGCWNNDWDVSLEIIKRRDKSIKDKFKIPSRDELISVFNNFYFGSDPKGPNNKWNGFICNEPILVKKSFFDGLTAQGIAWGFVSGAERVSAQFLLEDRLGLNNPPLIAMGEAPDKPDPTGFLALANQLSKKGLGKESPPVAYVGDTVADVKTIYKAKQKIPDQNFISLAIAPPHLRADHIKEKRLAYEKLLIEAGADFILESLDDISKYLLKPQN